MIVGLTRLSQSGENTEDDYPTQTKEANYMDDPRCLFYSVIGPHGGETVEQILSRKEKDLLMRNRE